ncbi:hypothetical protein [Microlunatus soli]|uniref:LVIVD repeat-containing protein n=1 Tax=Microlunatus soli TaxID=630515 RepID=A0A1H1SSY4_9ACTN|nr:hypothetical protein [Microlunatus soli]SDS51045.1 hypothetical protein SAMN04489812_2125 [Microlunatus soli]
MIKPITSALVLAAVVAGLALLGTEPAAAEPRVETVTATSVPRGPLDLDYAETPGGASLPIQRATLSDVFAQANRAATYGKQCTFDKQPTKGKEPSVRWCFKPADRDTKDWYPQGVTSDADAHSDESWNGHKGLMVSWYDTSDPEVDPDDDGIEKGVRVTVVNTETRKYRHLLLVEPVPTPPDRPATKNYRAVTTDEGGSLHAGGIVWYGRYLYVADTKRGIRVFDLDNIYDLSADPNGDVNDPTKVGLGNDGKTYHGYGYRYVLPQVGRWENDAPGSGDKCAGKDKPMLHSWLSLDRASTPDRLIAGEYCVESSGPGRVAAWSLKDGKIANRGTPTQAFRMPNLKRGKCQNNIQGGLRNQKHWFFNASCKGTKENGVMYRFRPTALPFIWQSEGIKEGPVGPEDLSYRYRGAGDKRLVYSVSEHPGRRMIFARNTYDDYWVPRICDHSDGEPYAFSKNGKLDGLTCFEAKGDDQWVKDTRKDGRAFAVNVRTEYGKERTCVDDTAGWTECKYNHKESKCLVFRGGHKGSSTGEFFGTTRWVSAATGNPGCRPELPKICNPSDGEPYAFGKGDKIYGLTCFEAKGDDQWVLDARKDDQPFAVLVRTQYGKVRRCVDDTAGWTQCGYDHKENECVRFQGFTRDDTFQLTPWVSAATGNPGCKGTRRGSR